MGATRRSWALVILLCTGGCCPEVYSTGAALIIRGHDELGLEVVDVEMTLRDESAWCTLDAALVPNVVVCTPEQRGFWQAGITLSNDREIFVDVRVWTECRGIRSETLEVQILEDTFTVSEVR